MAWTLSTMATAIAELISVAGLWFNSGSPGASAQLNILAVVSPLMLFTAAVTGLVALCLAPLVYLFRPTPPPLAITVICVVIAVSPLVGLVVLAER